MDGQKRGRDLVKIDCWEPTTKTCHLCGHAQDMPLKVRTFVCGGCGNIGCRDVNTVKEFAEKAFAHVDLDWREFVRHDNRYERPAEVDLLIGDAAKAKKKLDWEPKVRFEELVRIMVDADLTLAEKGSGTVEAGRL
jgi:hypothetical protein